MNSLSRELKNCGIWKWQEYQLLSDHLEQSSEPRKENGITRNPRKNWGHPDHSTAEISKNTEKCPGDLWRLIVMQIFGNIHSSQFWEMFILKTNSYYFFHKCINLKYKCLNMLGRIFSNWISWYCQVRCFFLKENLVILSILILVLFNFGFDFLEMLFLFIRKSLKWNL